MKILKWNWISVFLLAGLFLLQPSKSDDITDSDTLLAALLKEHYVTKGIFPADVFKLISFAYEMDQKQGKGNGEAPSKVLFFEHHGFTEFRYVLRKARPNGQKFKSPKNQNTDFVVAYRVESLAPRPVSSLIKYVSVIREDFSIERLPSDFVYFSYKDDKTYTLSFSREDGLPLNSLTYAEFWINSKLSDYPPDAKFIMNLKGNVADNGGPESLIYLSRQLQIPNPNGINLDEIWKTFDPAKPEFTLEEIQSGAEKLGLATQVEKMTLSEVKKTGSPAVLFLREDGRFVTLISIDESQAVIVDRGLPRIVAREVLENRYSGELLLPVTAKNNQAAILCNDPIREIEIKNFDQEVIQQVTLQNNSDKTVQIKLEHPLVGVTQAKLSKDTLLPGETSTLTLNIRWRPILKTPSQNVFVNLRTNDPRQPTFQLAFLLLPPKNR